MLQLTSAKTRSPGTFGRTSPQTPTRTLHQPVARGRYIFQPDHENVSEGYPVGLCHRLQDNDNNNDSNSPITIIPLGLIKYVVIVTS